MLQDQLHRRLPGEDQLTGEQPERDAAERVDVGAPVEHLIRDQLRREKRRRAENHACGGDLRPLAGVARHDTEVHDLDEVVFGPQTTGKQIGWLDISVHEAEGVCFRERQAHLPE